MSDIGGLITNILPAGVVTLEITFGAWGISVVLGALLAIVGFSGRMLPRAAVTGVIFFGRSLPPLIVLYLVYFGLPSVGILVSPVPAAIIGLGVLDAIYSAEYFRGAFRTISNRQWEAALSLGMESSTTMRLVIIPQMVPFVMPPIVNSFVGLMKAAVYASAIGAPELLFTGENYMSTTGEVTQVAIFIIVLYLIVTIPLTSLARTLESRVRSSYGGHERA